MAIGKIATAHGIRSSIEAGRSYYDFTRGGETYKYAFGAVDRMSPSVVLTSDRVRSRAAFTLSTSALALTTFGRAHAPGRIRAIARPITRRVRERR
jgi:CelD/BcsL family acetyltransferase involved in cellulose biosynthesis